MRDETGCVGKGAGGRKFRRIRYAAGRRRRTGADRAEDLDRPDVETMRAGPEGPEDPGDPGDPGIPAAARREWQAGPDGTDSTDVARGTRSGPAIPILPFFEAGG